MKLLSKKTLSSGFTLIELMITVAVIAIIAAVAVPAYSDYVSRSRRADAKTSILQVQLELEKWRANNATYTTDMTDLGYTGSEDQSSQEGFYLIDLPASAAISSYLITAEPTGAQTGDSCGTFAIDQNGKNFTGTYADADCWNR